MAMLNNQRVNVLISDFLHQTGPQQGHVGHWPVLATRGSSWGPPLLPCSFQRSGRGDSWSFNGLIWGFYGKFMGWFLGTKQKLLGVQNLRPKFVGPRLHSFLSISTWPLANLDLSKWISSGLMWPIGRISHMKISICGWSCDGSDVLSRICCVKGRCKLAMSSVGRSPVPGACAERVEWSDWHVPSVWMLGSKEPFDNPRCSAHFLQRLNVTSGHTRPWDEGGCVSLKRAQQSEPNFAVPNRSRTS